MPTALPRLAALCFTLLAAAASATIITFETLDDMARRVPVIVRGRVARSVAAWDADRSRIWTWTELVVTDSLKGEVKGVVLVKQPGGEVGPMGQAVAGAAKFREGEECVLFLEGAPGEPGTFSVSGLSAGKVSFTEWQGQPAAVRQLDGIAFASPAKKVVEPVKSPEFLGSPEAFLARVRAALGGAK
jgi:hypothetical protein